MTKNLVSQLREHCDAACGLCLYCEAADEIERLERQLDLKLFSRRQMEEDLAIIRERYGEESIDGLLRQKRHTDEPKEQS